MLATLSPQEPGDAADSAESNGALESDVQAAALGAYKFLHGFSAQAFGVTHSRSYPRERCEIAQITN